MTSVDCQIRRTCLNCHQQGHWAPGFPDCQSRAKPTTNQCFTCGQDGHWVRECPENQPPLLQPQQLRPPRKKHLRSAKPNQGKVNRCKRKEKKSPKSECAWFIVLRSTLSFLFYCKMSSCVPIGILCLNNFFCVWITCMFTFKFISVFTFGLLPEILLESR